MNVRPGLLAVLALTLTACGSAEKAVTGGTVLPKTAPVRPAYLTALGKPRTIADAGARLSVALSKPTERSTPGGDVEVDVWLDAKNTGTKPYTLNLGEYLNLYTGGLVDWTKGEDTDTTNQTATSSGPRPVLFGGVVKPGAEVSGWASFLFDGFGAGHDYTVEWASRSFKPLALWTFTAKRG